MSSLGEKMKQLRVANNYSQRKLADMLGVNVSTISRIESGASNSLRQESLEKMSELFHIKSNDLASEKEMPDNYLEDSFYKRLCDNYEKSDERTKQAIKILLDL